MCGVPYHAVDIYLSRLIAKGYKVAICEQLEDPKTAKGIVKRDVIRVVTPGTVIGTNTLEEKKSNSYDNAMLFNDYFISEIIDYFRKNTDKPTYIFWITAIFFFSIIITRN